MLPGLMKVDLNTLILLRVIWGVFEAAVMTTSTRMIGDYHVEKERQKRLIMQTVFVSISGIVFVALGRFLGEIPWSAPFLAYGLFLIGVPFATLLLHALKKARRRAPATRFRRREVLGLYSFGLALAILILVVPIQLPLLLIERGRTSPLTIDLTSMASSIALLCGSLSFKTRADASFRFNFASPLLVLAVAGFVGGQAMLQDAITTAQARGLKRLRQELEDCAIDLVGTPVHQVQPQTAPRQNSDVLTGREYDVLCGLSAALSNAEVAPTLGLSEQTVKWHLKNLFQKCDAGDRKVAVAKARLLRLIPSHQITGRVALNRNEKSGGGPFAFER